MDDVETEKRANSKKREVGRQGKGKKTQDIQPGVIIGKVPSRSLEMKTPTAEAK